MIPSVAIVADDLTGAADTGVGFCRSGRAAAVTWAGLPLSSVAAEVLAVDTQTRASDASTARATVTQVVRSMRDLGARTLYKKVDSTLRGHVGVEVDAALSSWYPDSIALVAVAFPRTGRTTINGQVLVGGERLAGPGIVDLLRQAGLATTHLDLRTVRDGSIAAAVSAGRSAGVRAFVCDCGVDADLAAIARAGATLGREVVWVGSGGLAAELPAFLGPAPPCGWPPATVATGPVLLAVGSRSAIAREQAARVEDAGVVRIEVPARGDPLDPALAEAVAGRLVRHLRSGHDVLLTLATGRDTDDLQDTDNTYSTDNTDDLGPARRLGELLRPHADLVGGLVATGGDTATAILRAWDTTALRLVGEVEAGVPLSVSVAPKPVPVVTKAGAFGTPDALVHARAKLEAVMTSATVGGDR